MQGEPGHISRRIVEADLSDIAARQTAKWERRFKAWLAGLIVCAATLLVSTGVAAGSRGSVGGEWLAGLLPVFHARICRRPIDYRAIVLEDDTYELFDGFDLRFFQRVEELLAAQARLTEVDILIWDHPSGSGWWGLTRWTEPLTFFWSAWNEGEPTTMEHSLHDRIRSDIVSDLCASQPYRCKHYRSIVAAGPRSRSESGLHYREHYAVHRALWSGYAQNLATIAAIILLPFAFQRVRAAGLLAHRWRRMHQSMTCPICDYNLRGLPEARCPECGCEWDADAR